MQHKTCKYWSSHINLSRQHMLVVNGIILWNLSSGFGMTFLISISFIAAALSCSVWRWDFDEAGKVAMLSPLSTSTVATFTSLSPPPIGSLKFQLKFSNFGLGIFTRLSHDTFTRVYLIKIDVHSIFLFSFLVLETVSQHRSNSLFP